MVKNEDKSHPGNSDKLLLEDISRYFDCLLTDDEEKLLMRRVASATFSHPILDEARAVMGFTTLRSGRTVVNTAPASTSRHHVWNRIAGIAVAIALTGGVVIGIKGLTASRVADDRCFAYVNGTRIVEEDEVLRIICEDMKELNACLDGNRSDITDDMETLAPAALCFESQFDPLL
ncbi:MAG: hypothetical protein K2M62_02185 [Muribaculaceae bacterium]|nr:hypothetical protein [Muribaculaceae bacterium]